MTRWRIAFHLSLVAFLGSVGFAAATLRGTPEANACGSAGPFDFDTWEAEDYIGTYSAAIELATEGKAITFSYTVGNNEPIDVTYQGLQRGPRSARVTTLDKNLAIPPTIYKSIAWIEANWANAANTVPYGGVGPVLRSFDCGYGIGQITSGMANGTGTASGQQAVIGTHFLYNISQGVRILADKWNTAPAYRPIAGNGDPAMLEDWYYAIWSYNGFAFSNHPLNPQRDPLRGGGISPIYHCFDPSAPSYQLNDAGAVMFGYGAYTYPERVYGCMRYPPARDGVRLWNAQTFDMPDFTIAEVAAAFAPENFLNCQEAGFSGGCPEMDFPTTIVRDDIDIHPHPDTTPPRNPADVGPLLGDPQFSYDGPSFLALTAYNDGTVTSGFVTVRNIGKGVGPFRIRTSAPWLVVRHPNDPASRTLDGSVAVGHEVPVVLTKDPRVTQPGYDSKLMITLDVSKLPPGSSQGTVWIEPLLGGGGVFQIDVAAANGANSFPNRRILPGLAADN